MVQTYTLSKRIRNKHLLNPREDFYFRFDSRSRQRLAAEGTGKGDTFSKLFLPTTRSIRPRLHDMRAKILNSITSIYLRGTKEVVHMFALGHSQQHDSQHLYQTNSYQAPPPWRTKSSPDHRSSSGVKW